MPVITPRMETLELVCKLFSMCSYPCARLRSQLGLAPGKPVKNSFRCLDTCKGACYSGSRVEKGESPAFGVYPGPAVC